MIPSLETCKPLDDDLIELISLYFRTLGQITIKNYKEILEKLGKLGYDIIEQAKISLDGCPKAHEEFHHVTERILTFVTKEGYGKNVIIHSIVEKDKIVVVWRSIMDLLRAKKVHEAGVTSGQLFDFLFFYDFIPTN